MLSTIGGAIAACALLPVVLIAAATGAVTSLAATPLTTLGQLFDAHLDPRQLSAAQYCALGKITPDRNTGYGTYTPAQLANATTLYQVATALALPPYAATIATATALQESGLNNLDHGDRDSLGLFQQRPSQGWGTPEQILNPIHAATKFYNALIQVPNWPTIPLTQAAQAVQHSAYPNAYAPFTTAAAYLTATVSGALDQCGTTTPR
jgi:hypothetical protein